MNSYVDGRSLTGLAALACVLLLPGFAKAANPCLNIRPSFTFNPIIASDGRSTLEISAQAGCFWEVVSHSESITILSLNRGYGSGSIVFQVLPNKTAAPAPGFMRFAVHDLNQRHVSTLNLSIGTGGVLSSSVVDCTGRTKKARMCAVDDR
jgi:hypothetical protein